MLNKEEWRIVMEREGLSEFFFAQDSFMHEGRTVYEMDNDHYAIMFRIFPPAYCGPQTEEILTGFLSCGLPRDTIVQFTTFTSRNMKTHVENYEYTHVSGKHCNVDHPEVLSELSAANSKFLSTHADIPVDNKNGLLYYLRDFVNVITISFKLRDEAGKDINFEDIVSYMNKAEGSLDKFSPMDFDEDSYIRLVREITTPYDPLWRARRDKSFPIKDHFCNSNSLVEDMGKGLLRLTDTDEVEFTTQMRGAEKKAGFFERLTKKLSQSVNFKEYDRDNTSEEKEIKKSKGFFARVYSRKMFPEYIDLHTASDLVADYFNRNVQQQVPVPYLINLTVRLEDVDESIKKVMEDAQWNKWQLDNSGKLGEFFPELRMRAEEADDVINLIKRHGEIPMKAMWSMVLFGKDKNELERHSSYLEGVFRAKNWILQREDMLSLVVFLYSIPGQYHEIVQDWLRRFSTVYKSNAASIAPIVTDSRGYGEPVVQLYGRNGQPQGFDFFAAMASNKNAILVGPAGKGKSFTMSRVVWSYLNAGQKGKPGAKIRIIDSGHSYRTLCQILGGQYVEFPDGNDHCLNFFTNIDVEQGQVSDNDMGNIVSLIGIMAGLDLNQDTESNIENEYSTIIISYIQKAVQAAYKMGDTGKGYNVAGMHEVGVALKNALRSQKEASMREQKQFESDIDSRLSSLISMLYPFTDPAGQYYNYFNGKANIDLKKDLVVLDMDDLTSKEKRFRDVVFTAVTNQISREFYLERADGRRKLLIVDESWQLLDGAAGAFILGLYRRSRKLRGSIICISQSILDFHKNQHIRGIFENAFWRLYLEQDPSTMTTAAREGKLVLDDYAFRLLGSVETVVGDYSEIMVTTQSGGLMIGRVLATKVEYWINTQEEVSLVVIDKVVSSYGTTETNARLAIGFSEMNKTTIEDELTRIVGLKDRAVNELLQMLDEAKKAS